jgi:hypothetical protein
VKSNTMRVMRAYYECAGIRALGFIVVAWGASSCLGRWRARVTSKVQAAGCIEMIIEGSEQYHNRSKVEQQHKRKLDRPKLPYADGHGPRTVKQLVVCSCMWNGASNADSRLPMQSVKPDIQSK